jgi:hypothetical protein
MYPNNTSNENVSESECSIEISPDDIADLNDSSLLTKAKQTTSSALIMQRVSDETDNDKNVAVAGGKLQAKPQIWRPFGQIVAVAEGKRELKDEGHELTLEDHVSSSM